MSIVLSEVISPKVTLQVTSAGLPEGAGGVALRFTLNDGPVAFTLTDGEARWLLMQIEGQLPAGADTLPTTPA